MGCGMLPYGPAEGEGKFVEVGEGRERPGGEGSWRLGGGGGFMMELRWLGVSDDEYDG
jgi:hypothetical protein